MLHITPAIDKIEKRLTDFFIGHKSFNSSVRLITISQLGLFDVINNYNRKLSFKEQVNKYNNEYFQLISNFYMSSEGLNLDIEYVGRFFEYDEGDDFFVEKMKKNYTYIFDFDFIEKVKDLILKDVDFYSKKDRYFLSKTAYLIAIKYLFNLELDNVEVFINEHFICGKDFNNELSKDLLSFFEKDINLLSAQKVDEEILSEVIYDIDHEYWMMIIEKENSMFLNDLDKYALFLKLIGIDRITIFSEFFLNKNTHKNSSVIETSLFSLLILNIFEKLLKIRV